MIASSKLWRVTRLACLPLFVFIAAGCAPFTTPVETESAAPPPILGNYSRMNDTARFLAGMSGGGNARLESLRTTPAWQAHAKRMDQLFLYFDRGYLPKISNFRTELGTLTSPGVLFYPFGGPDYLFARGFFPGAQNYVLVGLEGTDSLPDFDVLDDATIQTGLNGLSTSLKSNTGASYFVTKDMRVDLETTAFRGTLPLLLSMVARSGQSIQSVTPVGIDASGALTSRSQGAACPGWHIVAGGKNLYYFKEDLSNDTLSGDKRLFTFVQSLGAPVTFVKSASYLMHHDNFSVIRNFVMNDSLAILQDSSGVPYRLLNSSGLSLSLYGNYTSPLDIFQEYYQADLAAAYRDRSPHPVKSIDFGVGYLRNSANACLILARR
ncbi:MAG: hypothetical protein KDN20_22675 [Verrucomicrobiae bacterium]|nr:hypothetical protein [Verrucomicrobiae bacterium]